MMIQPIQCLRDAHAVRVVPGGHSPWFLPGAVLCASMLQGYVCNNPALIAVAAATMQQQRQCGLQGSLSWVNSLSLPGQPSKETQLKELQQEMLAQPSSGCQPGDPLLTSSLLGRTTIPPCSTTPTSGGCSSARPPPRWQSGAALAGRSSGWWACWLSRRRTHLPSSCAGRWIGRPPPPLSPAAMWRQRRPGRACATCLALRWSGHC